MITYVGKSFWILQNTVLTAKPILVTLLEYDKNKEMYRASIDTKETGKFEFWIKRVDFVHACLRYERLERFKKQVNKATDKLLEEVNNYIERQQNRLFFGWDLGKGASISRVLRIEKNDPS